MAKHSRPPSWRAWFEEHGPRLLLFSRQQTRTEADAQDVLQDAMVRTWQKQEDGTPPPLPAVYAAIRRGAIDLARRVDRRVRRETGAMVEQAHVVWFERGLERDERNRQLERAVRQLASDQQEVLTLKLWSELTFEQIAETLEISPNTAASRYRYALQNLRRELIPTPHETAS